MSDADHLIRRSIPTDPSDRESKSPFFAELERQGMTPSREMQFVGTEPATVAVAAGLNLSVGDSVIARRKILFADGVPVRIATSYFSNEQFGDSGLDVGDFIMPTLQSALKAAGHVFGRANETLRARPVTEVESTQLECDVSEWVVEILRTSFDKSDTPIHLLQTVCLASRHVFDIAQPEGRDAF